MYHCKYYSLNIFGGFLFEWEPLHSIMVVSVVGQLSVPRREIRLPNFSKAQIPKDSPFLLTLSMCIQSIFSCCWYLRVILVCSTRGESIAREGGTTGRVATCVWSLSGAKWQVGRPLSVPYKSMRHDFPIPLGQTHDKWDLWRMMACGYVK